MAQSILALARHSQRHEQNLTNDIRQAIKRFDADVILLSACGIIDEGVPPEFEAMLDRIVGIVIVVVSSCCLLLVVV